MVEEGSTKGAEGAVDATTSSEIGVFESVVLKDFGDEFGGEERREVERTRESELVMLERGKESYREGRKARESGLYEKSIESASSSATPQHMSLRTEYSCDTIHPSSILSDSCSLKQMRFERPNHQNLLKAV